MLEYRLLWFHAIPLPNQVSSQFTIKPGFGDFVGVKSFKYMSRSPYTPGLTRSNGVLYMIPDWVEVLHETTLNDIKAFEEEGRGRPKML